MKNLLILCFLILSVASNAANYGKFMLTTDTQIWEPEGMTFLLSSAGEIKILENDDYYEIKSSFFFGEQTLTFRSGGDEDFVLGKVTLVNNKAISACAGLIDLPNRNLMTLGVKSFNLLKWNKSKKKYESVYPKNFKFSEKCEKELFSPYSEFETF